MKRVLNAFNLSYLKRKPIELVERREVEDLQVGRDVLERDGVDRLALGLGQQEEERNGRVGDAREPVLPRER